MKLLHWIQKQRNRKAGFTLVELIVVLVILAILAALLVPALTGYMDKAKEKQVIAETRSLLTAIQTEASELYATDTFPKNVSPVGVGVALADKTANDDTAQYYKKIVSLAELPSLQDGGNGQFFCVVSQSGKVFSLIYDGGKGYTGLYFSETNEYIATKTPESNSYLVTYNGKVLVCKTSDLVNSETNPWGRTAILITIGRNDLTKYN